jgi:ABC-2 type transport system ATP-binding protein
MPASAIKIQNLSVTLPDGFQALVGIDVELEQGKIIGFIGPSGAGKTTLMRVIVGRKRATGGSIDIFGHPAGSAILRGQMSYMTQQTSVYTDLTVEENLRYFAAMFGVPAGEVTHTVESILHTVELTDKAGLMVGRLSGGQKQRTSLAIALVGNPKLMVLDEPTVGLDPVLREQLWALFRRLAENGTTLIVSSHVMDEAERCDDLLLIRDGQLLAHGSPAALRKQTHTESVEHCFLKLVGEGRPS